MTTQPTVTGAIVDYIHGLTYDSLSEEVRRELKHRLVDGLGVKSIPVTVVNPRHVRNLANSPMISKTVPSEAKGSDPFP